MASDPNVQAIRSMPKWGKYIFDAFRNLQKQVGNLGVQTNGNLKGAENAAPPPITALTVTASGGVAHVQITDTNPNLYRGIGYHVQYAPAGTNFASPVNFHMGPSRDARIPVGTGLLNYRAFSDYPTSPASPPVYHGGATPLAIAATGSEQPSIPPGQGSGTGVPGEISGFGPIPYRGNVPPRRA